MGGIKTKVVRIDDTVSIRFYVGDKMNGFNLSSDEFDELAKQIATASISDLPGAQKATEGKAQTNTSPSDKLYMGTLGPFDANSLSFVPSPYAERIPLSASAPQPPPNDTTNHPNYYGWHPVAECIEISQHFNGNLAQAIQYIWRCGRKPDVSAIKDLEKSIDFLRFETDRIKRFEVGD